MIIVAVLLGVCIAGGLLFAQMLRWERRGQPHVVVVVMFALLVIETSLYSNQDLMPRSIFHPGSGHLEFRLPEVIITLALLARLVVHGRPARIGMPALAWATWAAWMTLETVEGILRHNSTVQMPYEAKAIIYVAGGYALAAGVPVRDYLDSHSFERLMRWSALAAVILDVLALTHRIYTVNLPLLPLPDFGPMGADTASVFVTLGVVGFMVELAKPRRNVVTLVCVVPLLLSTVASGQRAALLELGAAVTVLLVAAAGPAARRRLHVPASAVVVTALLVVGVVAGVSVAPALAGQQPVKVPFAANLATTFSSQGKLESAQDRTSQWTEAWADIRQHPVIGNGLGFEYSYYESGPNTYVVTDLTHNIVLDLWMRTGLIGLILFLGALIASIVGGVQAWRGHADQTVGVLALALVAVIVGLVTKGMVESIFEKYRVATTLGLSLGVLRSAVTSGGGVGRLATAGRRSGERV